MLYTAFSIFKSTPANTLDAGACTTLKNLMGTNEQAIYKIFEIFQNTTQSYREIVEAAVNLYTSSKQLLRTIAAMHLFAYLRLERVKYLLAVNNTKFMCFTAPNSIYEAARILKHFDVHGWTVGKSGVSVTLK